LKHLTKREGKQMSAREGDLIRNKSNVIFDVKGLVHPAGKVVAFPRFIPSPEGSRGKKNLLYGKVYSLGDRFKYLQQHEPSLIIFDPVFGETFCEVPESEIMQLYKPTQKLQQLRRAKQLSPLEEKALTLAQDLKKAAGIPWSAIGISGSIMAGLTTSTSDIDPLIYGEKNCRKAYIALQALLKNENSRFKPYTKAELQMLFDFRSKDTQMSFEDFEKVESRKAFQGKYLGVDYFVRFVKDYAEVDERYGDVYYRNSGYVKIKAQITDNSEALFTPCTYSIDNVQVVDGPNCSPIKEIVSFRGRFCEQAAVGEVICAQGKVEHVLDKRSGGEYYRLILGGKPSDYMVLIG
jgi:predicted nucleotidyltransferase